MSLRKGESTTRRKSTMSIHPHCTPIGVATIVAKFSCLVVLSLVTNVAKAEITITPVGTPVFEMVDAHLYAGATDSFPSLFPLHFPTRVVHTPPYDHEYADGLQLAGLTEGEVFHVADFTDPQAVHLGYVLVPGAAAPVGSTTDYASGPVIPNDIFPITIHGDVYLNGAPFELSAFVTNLPGASGVDGRSHFLVEHWENSAFAPPQLSSLVGAYEYRLTMRDINNNGYNVSGTFRVVPEPHSMAAITGMIGLVSLWRRYRSTRHFS
jgi:hypothetical protein